MNNHRNIYIAENTNEPSCTDCFVLSFPKAGRTWHRAMLGTYLALLAKRPVDTAFDLDALTEILGLKRVYYSHNGANFIDDMEPEDELVASPKLWFGKDVTLLVRDPRDILVSAYHHARFRRGSYQGSLSDFIRGTQTGIIKILTAYNLWHANMHLASSFRIQSYENMHDDPLQSLRDQLSVCGIDSPDEQLIFKSVEFCQFPEMRKREADGFYKTPALRKRSDDPRSMKTRVGKVGAFKDHMSAHDLTYIESTIEELGSPFASFYETG